MKSWSELREVGKNFAFLRKLGERQMNQIDKLAKKIEELEAQSVVKDINGLPVKV